MNSDTYQGGEIRLSLAESESSRCSGTSTPGVEIASTSLDAPGSFSLHGTVCWAGGVPSLDLLVWNFNSQASVPCAAGAYIHLAADSASDVSVNLVPGYCPARK